MLTTSRVIGRASIGKAGSVIDDDTIEALYNAHPERVCLRAASTALREGQALGNRAKQAASALVFGKDVILQTHGQDKYGRNLGDVFLLDGMNVNQELIKQGWC